jgi:hypothetical protein
MINQEYGCHSLENLVLNLKYPLSQPKYPMQRNSFSSFSNLNRPPPGFEGAKSNLGFAPQLQIPNPPLLNFGKSRDSYYVESSTK